MDRDDHSEAFKAFEAAGWSANAAGYDRLTGRITARVAGTLLDAAQVRHGARVLDVGCGPGDLCAAAHARGADPTGVDIADGMVAAAKRRHPGLSFRCADAEALPFDDATFDVALAAFVVNHLPRPERAAAEIRRVLGPGGRIAVAMWDVPERVPFLGLLDQAMRDAGLRRDAAVPPGPPAFRFADEEELRALLRGAGFEDVSVGEHRFVHTVTDAGELWDGVQTGSVRTAAQLRALTGAERARVRDALDRLIEARREPRPGALASGGAVTAAPAEADDGLALETAVKIAVGVSPAG